MVPTCDYELEGADLDCATWDGSRCDCSFGEKSDDQGKEDWLAEDIDLQADRIRERWKRDQRTKRLETFHANL